MPTWEDVVAHGTRLAGVELTTSYGTPSLRVRRKFLCRLRTGPDALVLRVSDMGEREALLQGQPEAFFSTPHYDGHPYVLVHLDAVDPAELAELVEEAWRTQAPKRLVAEFDGPPAAELAPGLWRWTARHPEWHPGDFGAEVACFALRAGEDLLLVDALLPAHDDGPVLEVLDGLADGATAHVLVTIGYHVRSAEALCERYGARVWGPPNCARRLSDPSRLTVLEPGDEGPAGVAAFAIGRPPRGERPLWLPSHRAVAFGDALVGTPDGDLRLWESEPVDARRTRWYRETFAPTLAPLLELPVERVLVTHGAPVLEDGATALREAVDAPPWYHRG